MNLEVKDISFCYSERKILEDISFSASSGNMLAILGRNGSGKTTLLRLLLGFLKPDKGQILIDSRNIDEMTNRERASVIAYIPQSSQLVYSHSVLDTVLMGRAPALSLFDKPGKKDIEKAREALRTLRISHLETRSVNAISGGERQLVLIARALSQEARILLLDEPTSSLDYSNQLLVMETAEELRRKGYTIIFSTHSPEQALMNATDVMIISLHHISFLGKPIELIDGRILESLYQRKLCIREIDTGENQRIICVPK